MNRRRLKTLGILVFLAGLGTVLLLKTDAGRRLQFLLGGAMANVGYRMQDHLEAYDFEHDHDITPDQIWQEVLKQNRLAAAVRKKFPRTQRHPLVAVVVCMDSRIDTNELIGDTRHFYYVIRTAGSVLSEKEEEMLELAVENGVKLILLTTHSDCAAEKVAADPEKRKQFPALAQAVDERQHRIRELSERPPIARRLAGGQLAIKVIDVDTMTEEMKDH